MFDSTVYNSVLYGNSAPSSGGMAYGTVYNSIIWGNGGGNRLSGSIAYSCCSEVTHGSNGCVTNNPLFVDAVNSNFQLQAGSPCINAGHNNHVFTINDLEGNPRIVGGVVDMGAYERQDAGTDVDADGLADFWEMIYRGGRHFTDPNTSCSNGVNNLRQAYVAGLDPNDPDSEFLTDILPGTVLQWQPCVSGRVYTVQWSTNLLEGFQPLETNIPWSAGGFTDSVHNARGQLFYKIDVEFSNPFGSGGGDDDDDKSSTGT